MQVVLAKGFLQNLTNILVEGIFFMKDKIAFLIPSAGLMVRDPITKSPLSPEGELKPLVGKEGRYWRRRIRDGGVAIGKPPITIPAKKKQKKEI
jgi:hypothetical protein